MPSELQLKMAHDILDYLCRRGMNEGNHLTEQELAEEFQVSRSPIRGALSFLAEKGVVERRRNRGFFIKVGSHDLRPEILSLPKTTDEELLARIVGDWCSKTIPQSFSESEFRRRYKLGRLSASRILRKLSDDGFISRNRGHGWRFEPTLNTRASYDESYAFRKMVEPTAIRLASFKLDRGLALLARRNHDAALERKRGNAAADDLADIDMGFHRLIGVSSRNRFVLAAIERQNALRRALKYANWNKARVVASILEHMEILDALERDEREEAAGLMCRHLEEAHRSASDRCLDDHNDK